MAFDKQKSGNIGIFLAAAKLSHLNYLALITSRNTKGYDIVILNPETNIGKGVQVKCSFQGTFVVLRSDVDNFMDDIQGKVICDHIFVDIADIDHPHFFTIPLNDLRQMLQEQINIYVNRARQTPLSGNLTKAWKSDEIRQYEDQWQLILP